MEGSLLTSRWPGSIGSWVVVGFQHSFQGFTLNNMPFFSHKTPPHGDFLTFQWCSKSVTKLPTLGFWRVLKSWTIAKTNFVLSSLWENLKKTILKEEENGTVNRENRKVKEGIKGDGFAFQLLIKCVLDNLFHVNDAGRLLSALPPFLSLSFLSTPPLHKNPYLFLC